MYELPTGESRTLGGDDWAGWNNVGAVSTMTCPPGSYISEISSNKRKYGDRGNVSTGLGIRCKDFNGKQTLMRQGGLGAMVLILPATSMCIRLTHNV